MERTVKGMTSGHGIQHWSLESKTPAYLSWAGYSFENICIKHHEQIKKRLGIGAVSAWVGSWVGRPAAGTRGAQIDLLFDRADKTITLCEIKFYDGKLKLTPAFLKDLEQKQQAFLEMTGMYGKKSVLWCVVTTEGVTGNNNLIHDVITSDDLF